MICFLKKKMKCPFVNPETAFSNLAFSEGNIKWNYISLVYDLTVTCLFTEITWYALLLCLCLRCLHIGACSCCPVVCCTTIKSHTSMALNEETTNAVPSKVSLETSLPKPQIKKRATNKSYLNTALFQRNSPHC